MPWDATIIEKSDEEKASIILSHFTSGDTKTGTKYALASLYVHPIVNRFSKSALERIRQCEPRAVVPGGGVYYNKICPKRMMVRREHVIPVESLYQRFMKLFDKGQRDKETILAMMPKLEIAVITNEEEHQLSQRGFRSSMTDGWWETPGLDPLARYRAAGLDDTIWVNWEEESQNNQRTVATPALREQTSVRAPAAGGRIWRRYNLNGDGSFPMSRLVEAVVQKYARDNHATLDRLRSVFPDDLQGTLGVVRGENWRSFTTHPAYRTERFFPPFRLEDGTDVYVCNQWATNVNFGRFLDCARGLGFRIEQVP